MLLWPVLILLISTTTLHAQQTPFGFVRPGDRVRVRLWDAGEHAAAITRTGVLATSRADSISVHWENGERTTLALSRIARFEVSDGQQRFVARGMGYGFLGGALAGAVIGSREEGSDYVGTPTVTAISAVAGGFAGAIIGGAAGALVRQERWSPVRKELPLRRMRLVPSLDGRSVGLLGHVRF